MRETILEGVEDDIRIHLGCDVMLVAAVMEIGKAVSYLVYKVQLTGEEVLSLINNVRFKGIGRPCGLEEVLVKDHHYVLTAFDD